MTVTTFDSDAPLSHGHVAGPPGSDRGWEQVVAPDTGGNPAGALAAVSDDGTRVIYGVKGGTPDSETGSFISSLFAERTANGWQTKKIFPSRGEAPESAWLQPGGRSDLSDFVFSNIPLSAFNGEASTWRLSPDGSPSKVYGAARAMYRGLIFVSDDATRVIAPVIGSHDPSHPSNPSAEQLYDISSGSPHLVSLLPDGNPPGCGVAEITAPLPSQHWVSPDGNLIFFPSRKDGACSTSNPQDLYVRDLQAEVTELVSSAPLSGPDCDADFLKSTPETDSVFFYTQSRLISADATPSGCGGFGNDNGDIYRYDLTEKTLQCVTCVIPGVKAGVTFSVNAVDAITQIGVADDGSRVYFNSTRRLLPGAVPSQGTYRVMVAGGELAYVGDLGGFLGEGRGSTISHDGAVAVFGSKSAGLNAVNGQSNGGTTQAYRYDDRDRSLVCVSCPPTVRHRAALPRGTWAEPEPSASTSPPSTKTARSSPSPPRHRWLRRTRTR